jgi:hypothetical protein
MPVLLTTGPGVRPSRRPSPPSQSAAPAVGVGGGVLVLPETRRRRFDAVLGSSAALGGDGLLRVCSGRWGAEDARCGGVAGRAAGRGGRQQEAPGRASAAQRCGVATC